MNWRAIALNALTAPIPFPAINSANQGFVLNTRTRLYNGFG